MRDNQPRPLPFLNMILQLVGNHLTKMEKDYLFMTISLLGQVVNLQPSHLIYLVDLSAPYLEVGKPAFLVYYDFIRQDA